MVRMRSIVTFLTAVSLAAPLAAGPAIGDKLAPFALDDATGRRVDLQSFAGSKAVVLMFIATRCPVSNAYNQRMATLAQDFGAKGVTFVGLNANREESAGEIVDHARQHGLTFPILKDVNNVQADRFDAQVTPEVFVYDSGWTLRDHGRIDDNRAGTDIKSPDLRNVLEALLAGRDLPVKETKAFGCTIKRVGR